MNIRIGLDWDDVVAPFNSIACRLTNEKYGTDIVLDDIDSWENIGKGSKIKEFYNQPILYKVQAESIPEANIRAVRELEKIADVYFITAVYQPFMSERAKLIAETFPELGCERVILGAAKHLVQFDIILDDNIKNVLDSSAQYPVLMRKPWNNKMTGLLSVNNMDEFVTLVRHILFREKTVEKRIPRVIALVGPTGSKKNAIAQALVSEYDGYSLVTQYSSKKSNNYQYLPKDEFKKQNFFEHTFYGGVEFGTKFEDIKAVLDSGLNPVMPLDMCGAIGMKRYFPTSIIYVNRSKESLLYNIVANDALSNDEKVLRIASIDAERKNKEICDHVINDTSENEVFVNSCAKQINDIISQ